MDTKWKKRKKIISFLIFFLGVSLSLGSLAGILKAKPSNIRIWQLDRLLEDDYQQSKRFREYVENRLENFLVMATGGEGLWGIWGYDDGTYYGGGYDGSYYYGDYGYSGFNLPTEAVEGDFPYESEDVLEDVSGLPSISADELKEYLDNFAYMQENYQYLLEAIGDLDRQDARQLEDFQAELEGYQDEMESYLELLRSYVPELDKEQIKPLTDEQRQKIAQKYHDSIKGDKNLLYTIHYDGKELYSNSDLLMADSMSSAQEGIPSVPEGIPSVPDGYNFILYFDGEKVRIYKDGQEIDVYGDGYYRDDSDWYLPGYANFQVDDTVKKATVCIAVAKEPVLYAEGNYGNGRVMQYDNSLYWMNANLKDRQEGLLRGFYGLAAGLILLFMAFLWRKSCREAAGKIADFQAKVWMECKILLLLGLFYTLYMQCRIFIINGYGYNLWEELFEAYSYDYNFDTEFWLVRELAGSIHPLFWVTLFWGIWLIWNDFHHNKKIWLHSLAAKIYRTFSAKGLNQSMTKKMSRRNFAVFLIALVYAALVLGEIMVVSTVWGGWNIPAVILVVFETVLFIILQYLAGVKNMGTARDVETLADRIAQIRDGDYRDVSDGERKEEVPVHDLKAVMDQLEDIRHGMAVAVDEQMKSERMKVELIANVSHDIKTPLTSIISYVEILKQEEELPDHIKDYVKILDEKSQRLNNMVQDVFAVSKAASGELPMQMEELDFGKLLRQTLADMEEQIKDSDVTFRTELPDIPVMIMADGQRMYRVFQNLFQNAIKYSLQGSRVYITLREDGGLAMASVKNTSRQELDKDRDFAERFARGDQSRTDGGSGLGLSIAQSFTEACGGEFSWETDADLFIVRVVFKVL